MNHENPPQKTILVLSANPKGTAPLRLDEEIRDIKEVLRRAKEGNRFKIESAQASRYRDIQDAILHHSPTIIHFSGHGAGAEGLVFEDYNGQQKLVDTKALAQLFSMLAQQIEFVVLNACYSEIQAQAIAQHIDYVIGMSKPIGDPAAIEFAVGFYQALGYGKDVEEAYNWGCNAIQIAGIAEDLTPQLLRKQEISGDNAEYESQQQEEERLRQQEQQRLESQRQQAEQKQQENKQSPPVSTSQSPSIIQTQLFEFETFRVVVASPRAF